MLRNRHAEESGLDESSIAVRSLGLRMPAGHHIGPHTHTWHQLIHATEGVMTVDTSDGSWVIPPERAAWIPAQFNHEIRTTGQTHMRTLYLRPDLATELPPSCCVIEVTPLLRELILEAFAEGMLLSTTPQHMRLALVLLDQVARLPQTALQIVLPTDHRALHVANKARADLSDVPSISDLAKDSGASARTIERLFIDETGLSFGRWIRRAKALHAIELLAAGNSVVSTGVAVGYRSTSAFIKMFKQVLGQTPGKYFTS